MTEPVVHPQLAPGSMALFEQVSLRHDALIPTGVKPEQMERPDFWAHHATKLQPLAEIRARAEDGTWIAYCVVLDTSRNWAKVKILEVHHLTTADVALSQASETEVRAFIDAHRVVHRGPHKWSVVRIADKSVLMEGEGTKDGAVAWLQAKARDSVGAPASAAKAEPATT